MNRLNHRLTGPADAPIVLFLHGFMGSLTDWQTVIDALEGEYRCLAVDLPGHGDSTGFSDSAYTMEGAARLVVDLLDELEVSRANVVGYSMGGRLALYLAIEYGERCERLCLESASPGLELEVDRITRRGLDEARAIRLETDDYDSFLEEWYRQPLFATLSAKEELISGLLEARRANDPHELARSLRGMGTGRQPSLWERIATLEVPTLAMSGALDGKYVEIAEKMAVLNDRVRAVSVPNTGHIIHLENPEAFILLLRSFFAIHNLTTMPTIEWKEAGQYTDIKYHKAEGIAKITINRPDVRNAFRPLTVKEMSHALNDARDDLEIGVIILTGEGTEAFCSGGDQKIRGDAGYKEEGTGLERLNVLDFQRQIRTCPKPVIAMVAGWAVGGGHVLHVLCDLTIAAENARFMQTGPKVGSFDAGYGASYLARIVGQKKAREIWFLCRPYNAQQALEMGLVNAVVPLERLEEETVQWCREILANSQTAIRFLKAGLNADCDGQAGLQELAGSATMLFYMSEEGQEGRNAFVEKRKPDFSKFPYRP